VTANFTTTVVLDEPFADGLLPTGWRNESTKEGWWWFNRTDNKTGGEGHYALGAPVAGFSPPIDIALLTPSLDLTAFTDVGLEFKMDISYLNNATTYVDVSTNGGSLWTNVWWHSRSERGPLKVIIDLSPWARTCSNVTIRFRAFGDFVFWSIDDIKTYAVINGETDADGDGVIDVTDNFPDVANASQSDVDGDDIGDACDNGDFDGDGLTDAEEYALGTDPAHVGVLPPEYVFPSFITPFLKVTHETPLDGNRPLSH
jgi:hypothetical protein